MPDAEAPLTPDERLLLVGLYARVTSKDVLRPRQHNAGNAKRQVERSHILVSHSKSHNRSHMRAS